MRDDERDRSNKGVVAAIRFVFAGDGRAFKTHNASHLIIAMATARRHPCFDAKHQSTEQQQSMHLQLSFHRRFPRAPRTVTVATWSVEFCRSCKAPFHFSDSRCALRASR